MPLIHGKSPESFSKNVKTEMHHGKPMGQALAIAYSMKKKAQHKAYGGKMCAHGKYMCHECHGGGMAEGGEPEHHITAEVLSPLNTVIKQDGKWLDTVHPRDAEKAIKKHSGKRHHMAEGGFVGEEKASGYLGMPEEHEMKNHHAMREDDRMLNQHGADEVAAQGMEEDNEPEHERMVPYALENQDDHEDMVGRIMRQRAKHYSRGGQVSNDTPIVADLEENQFDDLVKDDDLDSHYTGANSGDEIGNEQEDEDRRDIVSRIMKSRRLKDRLPHPA
jgi:hypothetical protein